MATQPSDLRMSLAEFLDWDDGTDMRYELIDGRVVAMAPPNPRPAPSPDSSPGSSATDSPLPAASTSRRESWTPQRANTYLQADLAVSCRPLDQQDRDVAEPILVVEWYRRARSGTTAGQG